MSASLAAPYPADTRAKGWRLELDYERIDQSDTWGLAGAMAFDGLEIARPLLLAMWYAAWKQTPCGSLPADEKLIAAAVGIRAAVFAEYRDVLMRGWWRAEDGRLYHDTLAARVLEMIESRSKNAERVARFKAAKREQLAANALPERDSRARNDTGTGTSTREDVPPKPPRKRRGDQVEPDGFSEFWKAYPRKVGIDAARKAFAKRDPDAATVAGMVNAIRDQGLEERVRRGEVQYVPHPSTWLNEGRWLDETAASVEAQHWFESVKGVIAKGIELGVGSWSEAEWAAGRTTDYLSYRARVFKAAGHSPRAAHTQARAA